MYGFRPFSGAPYSARSAATPTPPTSVTIPQARPRRLVFAEDELSPAFQRRFSPAPGSQAFAEVLQLAREVLRDETAAVQALQVIREVLRDETSLTRTYQIIREVLVGSPGVLPAPVRRLLFPEDELSPAFRRVFAPVDFAAVVVVGLPPRLLLFPDDDLTPAFRRAYAPPPTVVAVSPRRLSFPEDEASPAVRRFLTPTSAIPVVSAPLSVGRRRLPLQIEDDVSPAFQRRAAPLFRRRPQVLVFS